MFQTSINTVFYSLHKFRHRQWCQATIDQIMITDVRKIALILPNVFSGLKYPRIITSETLFSRKQSFTLGPSGFSVRVMFLIFMSDNIYNAILAQKSKPKRSNIINCYFYFQLKICCVNRQLIPCSRMEFLGPRQDAAEQKILCCECGTLISPNPANMCVACIRTRVDVSENIPKQVGLFQGVPVTC